MAELALRLAKQVALAEEDLVVLEPVSKPPAPPGHRLAAPDAARPLARATSPPFAAGRRLAPRSGALAAQIGSETGSKGDSTSRPASRRERRSAGRPR